MKKMGVAIGFAVTGVCSWWWPSFNGFFFAPSDISAGDGRIVGTILIVGAAILWFMPRRKDDD